MSGNDSPATIGKAGRLRPLAQLVSVLAIVSALTVSLHVRASKDQPLQPPSAATIQPPEPIAQVIVHPPQSPEDPPIAAAPEPEPELAPPPPPPQLDRVAVASAEAALDEASRDRARAEARAADAASRLAAATRQAALDGAMARKLAFRIRDPSAQISRIASRGSFLRSDVQKLQTELATLRTMPRPKATSILTKSPVARPAGNDEFHFELRRNRVSFIDLERLMDLAKSDAQLRIRMTDHSGLISSQVGPVGSFSLAYVLGRSDSGLEELMQRQSVRFDLRGWELVPEQDQRGETYEATRNPISAYQRALNRIGGSRSVVTIWVYPDSFALYRRLRAELIAAGFSVAGRPLPDGMTIRGSPMGSVSAAQ